MNRPMEQSPVGTAKRKRLFGDAGRTSKLLRISLLAVFLVLAISVTHIPRSFAADVNITFDIAGIGSDASGTIITIDGTDYVYTDFPLSAFVWAIGTTHTINVPVVSAGTGKQYVWSSWTNGDGLSGSSGTYTTPGSDATVTVNYMTQWEETFHASANVVDATGTLVSLTPSGGTCSATTINTPSGSVFCDDSTSLAFSFTDPLSSVVGGKQYGFVSADTSSPISVTAPVTVTGTYLTQWRQTFHASANVVDATGTLVSLTPSGGTCSASSIAAPGGSVYCDDSTSLAFSFTNHVTSSVSGKLYAFVSADATSPISVTAPNTVTGTYVTTWEQTFQVSANVVDAAGTVLTLFSTQYPLSALPLHVYLAEGITVTYSYTDPLSSTVDGKRYSLTTPAPSPASGYTVDGTTYNVVTITGTYVTQWEQTFQVSANVVDATGRVVIVYAVPVSAGSLPYHVYVDEGSTVTYFYTDPLSSTVDGKRYSLTTPAPSPASGYTVTGANTIWGSYQPQYQVTFTSSGIGTDTSTATVVTINTVAYPQSTPLYQAWFDSSSTINYAYSDPVAATTTGKQYAWVSTSGLGQSGKSGSFTVAGTGTVTGSYKTQYYLTVTSTRDTPSGQGWYDSGSVTTSTVLSPVSGGAGTRYVCTGWTGTGSAPASGTVLNACNLGPFIISQPSSVTWNWKTQYSISFGSSGIDTDTGSATIVSVNGLNFVWSQLTYTAWYDSSSTIGYTFSSTVSGSAGRQYLWTITSGTLGRTGRTGSFTVSGGGTVIGNYNSAYMAAIIGAVPNPDPSVLGSTVTFTVGVQNTGANNMAAQVMVNIWRSDGVWAASPAAVITSFLHGSTRTVQISYTTALIDPTGTWMYTVQVYYGTTLLDILAHQTFTVNARSNLSTISVTPPASAIRGARATFAVTVNNVANVAWSGTIKIVIYNGRGGVVTTLTLTTPNLNPSIPTYGPYSLSWLVPSTLATGSYTYNAYLYSGTTQLDIKSGSITVS